MTERLDGYPERVWELVEAHRGAIDAWIVRRYAKDGWESDDLALEDLQQLAGAYVLWSAQVAQAVDTTLANRGWESLRRALAGPVWAGLREAKETTTHGDDGLPALVASAFAEHCLLAEVDSGQMALVDLDLAAELKTALYYVGEARGQELLDGSREVAPSVLAAGMSDREGNEGGLEPASVPGIFEHARAVRDGSGTAPSPAPGAGGEIVWAEDLSGAERELVGRWIYADP